MFQIGKIVSKSAHGQKFLRGLDNILSHSSKARSIYESLEPCYRYFLEDGHMKLPIYRRAFLEARILNKEFGENVSRLYGVEIPSLSAFECSGEIFGYFLSGSEINPVTKRVISPQIRKALLADYKTIKLVQKFSNGGIPPVYGENGYVHISDGMPANPTSAHKRLQILLRKRKDVLSEPNEILFNRLIGFINEGKYSEVPGIKLRTSRLTIPEAKPLDSPFLNMARETSQKAGQTKIDQRFVERHTPNLKQSEELKSLNQYFEQQAQIAERLEQEADRLKQVYEKESISNPKFDNQVLKSAPVLPYPVQSTIERVRQLRGNTAEIVQQSSKIFLEELRYDPEILPVEVLSKKQGCFMDGDLLFNVLEGKILVNPYTSASPNVMASMIRHEIDHFQLFADLCKTIGVDNFRKLYYESNPKARGFNFNTEFWQKAIENAKILSKSDVSKYAGALRRYTMPKGRRNIYSVISYFGNPIETRAYDISASMLKSLKSNSSGLNASIASSRISRKILSVLDIIEKKKGIKLQRERSIQNIFNDEVLANEGNSFCLNKVLNSILNHLENLL